MSQSSHEPFRVDKSLYSVRSAEPFVRSLSLFIFIYQRLLLGLDSSSSWPSALFLCFSAWEPMSPAAQHLHSLFKSHIDLVTHGDETLCQVDIVLAQQVHGDENVVDVSEDQCPFLGISFPALDKCHRVISPVATRVQVVRCVVSVIEGVPVALYCFVSRSAK